SMLSLETVEELKKELSLIPEGKLDAQKLYWRQDDDDLTYASGSKSSYRPKKKVQRTAEVIEQRKERMALEQGY
ncbi:2424_t:CDS:2, partial [Racocetra fulgida]